ncbi:LacI family DNA-binding transcriptional regulator [Microbacterium rhizosphaerae]|uniref:LacI family DNA-binding transcriptional regulator n=1 Tax=Microbacterium rhizosphaerae TaxID=1678237 RepID=A0ABZ0SJ89_9MICO|nr:LacI family DNA-binding transcriptional regulator [Microbacterium rhizosphaerae]WPR89427.1 LacI family DNA-binding transcriptional regulator [Microbacterium rhizosphaerae]
MTRSSGAATITQVAKHAGVSPATVSRVMNGRFAGEPEVAERVRQSAAELAYSPSHLARSLALGQTHAIAFVVPDLANPAFQAMLSSLSKAAAKDGYRVLVADSAESPQDEPLLVAEVRGRCDAIVLCAPRMTDAELVHLGAGLKPLVLINRANSRLDAPSLSIDYQSGIRNLVRHLYDLGHRHLVYLDGPPESASNRDRLAGLDEMQRLHPDLVVDRIPAGASIESGTAAARAVTASSATAVVAYNDLVAIGAMNGLLELGVRVPEDISVTGFDDIPFARYTTPPLTTVSVPHEELGGQAWLRMRALLAGEVPGHDVVFQPRVEQRRSTGEPRS